MIYQVEPLMVMAEKCGIRYKKGLLDRIWKLLNKNHAHDSAGGCNSDKTNQIITDRFVEADQLSYSLVDYLTRKISESRINVLDGELVIFNTLPCRPKKLSDVSCRRHLRLFHLKKTVFQSPLSTSIHKKHSMVQFAAKRELKKKTAFISSMNY